MTLQLQVPKQKEDNKIYVVIVGADGRKFNNEQEQQTKDKIFEILNKHWHEYVEPSLDFGDVETELILVSGGCPVGKKRWYCVDCDMWLGGDLIPGAHVWLKHKLIEVYDNGGIDTWAHIEATKLGIPTLIFKPEVHQWLDRQPKQATIPVSVSRKGYRSRNIDMAEIGTIGYTIEVAGSCRQCGGKGWIGVITPANSPTSIPPAHIGKRECNKCKGTGAYSGGTFTINEMQKLGKEVHKIVIT